LICQISKMEIKQDLISEVTPTITEMDGP